MGRRITPGLSPSIIEAFANSVAATHASMTLPLFDLPRERQQVWLIAQLARPAPRDVLNRGDGHRLAGREGPPRPAAVLIPLVNRAQGLTVLFTERSESLVDHAGQISFPGGRIEPDDIDSRDAALREADEEIGLKRDRVTILGHLAPYDTVTGFRIDPVVAWVEPPFVLAPDPTEVAAVFEVPLRFLLDQTNQQRHFRMMGEVRRDYYAIPYRDHYIWGVTAGILIILDRTLRIGA